MPTYLSDGVPLHYLDTVGADRAQSRLPVVLLHAFPVNAESFRPQLESLGQRHRLLVPDLRGFGHSPPLPGATPLEMSRIARDVLALLDHLRIDQVVLGGCSMGGYASMAVLREDPSRVQKLVLIDSRDTEDDDAGRARREATARQVEAEGIEPLVAAMMPKLLSPNAPPSVRKIVEGQTRAASVPGAAAAARGMALRPDSRELLSRFGGPTLVVVGEHDTVTPPEDARAMAERIPNGMLEVIPDAGHLSHLEVPAVFNSMLEAFLTRF